MSQHKAKFGYIYGLIDPRTNVVCYIGKTTNPKKRLKDHLVNLRKPSLKVNWIKSLKSKGLVPIIKILKECEINEMTKWEIFFIEEHRKTNSRLKNMTVGGDGGAMLFPKKNPNNKKVIGSNLKIWPKEKTFFSMSAAARFLKTDQTNIFKSATGKANFIKGWFFRFEGTVPKIPEKRKRDKRSKIIVCSNNQEYPSMVAAATALGISAKMIFKAIKFNVKTSGLSFWRKGETPPAKKKGIEILCVTNGVVYENSRVAAKELGLAYQKISEVLRGDRKHIKGFVFQYNNKTSHARNKNKIVILTNMETNQEQTFNSLAEAAIFLGYTNSKPLSDYIKSNRSDPIKGHLVTIKLTKELPTANQKISSEV